MPKTKISEFSSTPANNTDIDSIFIGEGMAPSNVNDAIRELMAQLKDFQVGSAGDPVTVGGVLTVQAGTAAAPAITTAGDTNTGIFFPAADTIAFSEGGAEAMRLDSSGNLGLGVTPSAWANAKAYQVGVYAAYAQRTAGTSDLVASWNATITSGTSSGTGYVYRNTGDQASAYEQNGAHRWYIAPSGTAGNAITFTQAMTLDASGNLVLGATSALGAFEIVRNSASGSGVNYPNIRLDNQSSTGYTGLYFLNSGTSKAFLEVKNDVGALTMGTGGSERARIDSSGNLLVGATTANAFGIPSIQAGGSNSNGLISVRRDVTSTADQIIFYNPNGLVGRIETTGSATSYTTSSDYRLKNTIAPMTGALAKVALLKPCTYKWNADGSDGQGFIAHELAEVVPECVSGEKDGLNKDGNPMYQGIDTSFLVATLTAAIQEQQAIIESLKARLDAANL